MGQGTRVLVNMWSIHHDPRFWEQPDLFAPGDPPIKPASSSQTRPAETPPSNLFFLPSVLYTDRFLDDRGQRATPSCFLPFGAGPRVCVGESLARLELFLFLSSLLQRMSFRLPDGASPPNLQGRLGVVLQPLPYKVVVSPRPGWEGGAK